MCVIQVCVIQHRNWPLRSTILDAHGTNASPDGLCTRTHTNEAFSCRFCGNSFRVGRGRCGNVCLEINRRHALLPISLSENLKMIWVKDGLGTNMTPLLSGKGDILVPVLQHKHGVGLSPPRGARSGGHASCQAARTAATCT